MKILRRLGLFLALALPLMAAPSSYFNAALSNSTVLVRAAPSGGNVRLCSINASNNDNASSGSYIQVFDSATAGAITPGVTAPLLSFAIPAGGVLDKDLVTPVAFFHGIVILATTTSNGGTAPGSAIPISITYE